MDYTRPNLDLVKEGKVYGLVAQPLYEEFYRRAELLVKAIDGETIEYRNLLPAPIILLPIWMRTTGSMIGPKRVLQALLPLQRKFITWR